MTDTKKFLRKLVATVFLVCHFVPTSAVILNPLIGMIAPIGVEWILLSPWSPFYMLWETRWLVFMMVSIPNINGINPNPLVGWTLFAIGLFLFLAAFIQFLAKRKESFMVSGLYSKVRHPQYLGIITATLGFTITSERPIAWISWLTLTSLYLLLANTEENHIHKKYGQQYENYRQRVPFIMPCTPPNITEKLPIPKPKLKKYSLLIYVIMIIIAWIILKEVSYKPEY
jgi:protein-S-isoprenylcysteine O-methyltransferase Ste14